MSDYIRMKDGREIPVSQYIREFHAERDALRTKLDAMTATMARWRTLAGQMTEARDALLGEVGVLREALEAEMSHTRERIERVTAGLVNIQRHRDAWRRYASQGGPKPGDYVEDAPALASGAGSGALAVIEAAVAYHDQWAVPSNVAMHQASHKQLMDAVATYQKGLINV